LILCLKMVVAWLVVRVSMQWRDIVKPNNFAHIMLTFSRFSQLDAMTTPIRAFVRSIRQPDPLTIDRHKVFLIEAQQVVCKL
jgi:hypothetical protein